MAEAAEMAKQLEQEMYLIDMIFTIVEVLEILIDIITFNDLWKDGNHFDSGTIAGKGVVNACFTLYYIVVDNFFGNDEEEVPEEEDEGDIWTIFDLQ